MIKPAFPFRAVSVRVVWGFITEATPCVATRPQKDKGSVQYRGDVETAAPGTAMSTANMEQRQPHQGRTPYLRREGSQTPAPSLC